METQHSALKKSLSLLGFGVFLFFSFVWPGLAPAYQHHASSIAFREYTGASFEEARRLNKPLFVVLSAAWCFECKIYYSQTLNQEKVAAFLNRNFVNIFVDLDERQDLQHLYVNRGIPTSVIFTPRGEKFISFSGRLPPQEFIAGVSDVLKKIRQQTPRLSGAERPSVKNIRNFLEEAQAGGKKVDPRDFSRIAGERTREFLAVVREQFDQQYAGFGHGRKYTLAPLLVFLLETHRDSGDLKALEMALQTLNRIAGELYDPVEGGFFHYATQRTWKRVRYEKLLVNNLYLVRAFQLAAALTPASQRAPGSPSYETVYRKSLAFVLTTFYRQGGGLYGSMESIPAYYHSNAAQRATMNRPKVDSTIYTAWNGEAIQVLSEIHGDQPSPRLRLVLETTADFLRTHLVSATQGLHAHYRPSEGKPAGGGKLMDNGWGALGLVAGFRLTERPEFRKSYRNTFQFVGEKLLIGKLGVYRLWNMPDAAGLRQGETVSSEVPLAENGIMAFAYLNGYEATHDREYLALSRALTARLAVLEPDLFQDDPGRGKSYLGHFVYYLKTLNRLARLKT